MLFAPSPLVRGPRRTPARQLRRPFWTGRSGSFRAPQEVAAGSVSNSRTPSSERKSLEEASVVPHASEATVTGSFQWDGSEGVQLKAAPLKVDQDIALTLPEYAARSLSGEE